MRFLDVFRRRPDGAKATELNALDRLTGYVRESSAGTMVTEITALQVATVQACVKRISQDVASMPLKVRRQRDGRLVDAQDVPEWRLLAERPNPWHTSREFRQMITMHALLRGDGYAFLVRGGKGRVLEAWPLQKSEVQPIRRGFELTYNVVAYDGEISGIFPRENIMHLRGDMFDGVHGLDQLLYARDVIGLASAAQGTQAKSFKNGNRMPGYWATDGVLEQEQAKRLGEELRALTSGENQYRSPVLDGGLQYKPAGNNMRDSQMVETRKHEMIEVCAALGVIPAVLGIDDKTQAFASVEAMMQAHLVHTLRPWLVGWEQTLDRDVLDREGPLVAKHDTAALEKATTKDRAESRRSLSDTMTLMPSELRALEGYPPIPGLDEEWMKIRRGMAGIEKGQSDET